MGLSEKCIDLSEDGELEVRVCHVVRGVRVYVHISLRVSIYIDRKSKHPCLQPRALTSVDPGGSEHGEIELQWKCHDECFGLRSAVNEHSGGMQTFRRTNVPACVCVCVCVRVHRSLLPAPRQHREHWSTSSCSQSLSRWDGSLGECTHTHTHTHTHTRARAHTYLYTQTSPRSTAGPRLWRA